MNTSAGAARKATTEEEKRQYREKGCCFECGKQGHLARNCLDKKTQARTTNVDATADATSEASSETITATSQISASDIAARVIKMSDALQAIQILPLIGPTLPVNSPP